MTRNERKSPFFWASLFWPLFRPFYEAWKMGRSLKICSAVHNWAKILFLNSLFKFEFFNHPFVFKRHILTLKIFSFLIGLLVPVSDLFWSLTFSVWYSTPLVMTWNGKEIYINQIMIFCMYLKVSRSTWHAVICFWKGGCVLPAQ